MPTGQSKQPITKYELVIFGFVRKNYKQFTFIEFGKRCLEEQEYLISMIEKQPQTMKFGFIKNVIHYVQGEKDASTVFHDKCDEKQNYNYD